MLYCQRLVVAWTISNSERKKDLHKEFLTPITLEASHNVKRWIGNFGLEERSDSDLLLGVDLSKAETEILSLLDQLELYCTGDLFDAIQKFRGDWEMSKTLTSEFGPYDEAYKAKSEALLESRGSRVLHEHEKAKELDRILEHSKVHATTRSFCPIVVLITLQDSLQLNLCSQMGTLTRIRTKTLSQHSKETAAMRGAGPWLQRARKGLSEQEKKRVAAVEKSQRKEVKRHERTMAQLTAKRARLTEHIHRVDPPIPTV
ncbi:hypothetical protein KIPB_001603 [Kipferlia bialata]|uniref:Uncharacterized protein n=1 Tax=Kipferlia bialata TaxID=797122 RepID=A0A391NLX9_9EUKA|nr:hypothetical protein KIPB_001603 [Kipferlia bialata]|eukprot:g1603.t1